MSSKPKNCFTCAHSYGFLKEFKQCARTGFYCSTELKYPNRCGGKDLPLYEEKVSIFDKLFRRK